jgi:hypothetical protein
MKSKFLQFVEGYLDDDPSGDPIREMARAIMTIKESIKDLPEEDQEAALNQAIKELRDEYKDSVLKEEDEKPDHIKYLNKVCAGIEERLREACAKNPKKFVPHGRKADAAYTKNDPKNPFHSNQSSPGENFEGSAE